MLRKKCAGEPSVETLGEWPQLSLQRAREYIRAQRGKEADPGVQTVRELCDRFYDGVIKAEHEPPNTYKRYLDRDLKPAATHIFLYISPLRCMPNSAETSRAEVQHGKNRHTGWMRWTNPASAAASRGRAPGRRRQPNTDYDWNSREPYEGLQDADKPIDRKLSNAVGDSKRCA